MNHPTRENWIPYLFGEGTSEAEHELNQHLADCPQCTAEMAGWRRTLDRLNQWKLPEQSVSRAPRSTLSRWAAAAAIALGAGLGFGFGRFSAPVPDSQSIRAEIESSLRTSLAAEVRQQSRRDFTTYLQTAREEDRQAAATLVLRVQEEENANYMALRKDLETVASLTDDALRQAREKITQLAMFTEPQRTNNHN